jgi:lipopolysaccharide transport system permease protein
MPLEERINSAESSLRYPGRAFRAWRGELRLAVPLGLALAKRDIQAKYRQTLLGYLWAVLPTVGTTLTFVFLNQAKLLNAGETQIPYPVYAFHGALFWQLFSIAVLTPIELVHASKAILSKLQFPREALLIAAFLLIIFDLGIKLCMLLIVIVAFGVWPDSGIWLFPLVVAITILLGMAVGVFLVPFHLIFNDVRLAVVLALSFMVLITPVGFVAPQQGLLASLIRINPLSILIDAGRASLASLPLPEVSAWGGVGVVALVVISIAVPLYHVALPIVVERQSS